MSGVTDELLFMSRRPVVVTSRAAVACGQPQAANAALEILKQGGNAADAAVACAAAMNVTQPISTGLGGDAFCLYYDACTKSVRALNGSGRSPASLTLDKSVTDGFHPDNPLPRNHGHCVTVPGAPAAWCDTVHHFGNKKLTLMEILKPAISLAENGFPVSEITSYFWKKQVHLLLDKKNPHGVDMCVNGGAPRWGETFVNKHLAETFKMLGRDGKNGYYKGRIAEAIVKSVTAAGGVMTSQDLASHMSTLEDPISVEYNGVRLWETKPNSHGIVALMALNILKHFNLKDMGHNTADYMHTVLEALRLGFADAEKYIADPHKVNVPIAQLLEDKLGKTRSEFINMDRCMQDVRASEMFSKHSDTVYLTVVDDQGNACSFINSNYMGFGTGIVPEGCGFTLQNRGSNFSLEKGHLNQVDGNKRPYNTIIPAMVTDDKTGELLCSFGVMGGFMQPQGHVQVLLNMLEFSMHPQRALDQPRFCLQPTESLFPTAIKFNSNVSSVCVEEGISHDEIEKLRKKGHKITGPIGGVERALFGRGHVITKGAWWRKEDSTIINDRKTLWAGSDPRADGLALGY